MTDNLSFYNEISKSFIYISSDNRIHLWDIENKKEKRVYVEKNHLSHIYTCADWSQNHTTNGIASLGIFAVGSSDGTVIIWDLVRGIVQTTIKNDENNSSITDVVFSNDLTSIFVSSTQSHIIQYNISNNQIIKKFKAGKKGATKLAINPKLNVIAIASTKIKLVDIDSDNKKKLDASFIGGANCLEFSSCGCYILASSERSREILIFDIQAKASLKPIQIITLTNYPIKLLTKSYRKKDILDIFCINDDKSANVYRLIISSLSNDNIDTLNTKITSYDSIISGSLLSSKQISIITKDNNASHVIDIEDSNGLFINDNIAIENKVESNGIHTSKLTDEITNDVQILGPLDIGAVKRPFNEDNHIDSLDKSTNGVINKRSKLDEDISITVDIDSNELSLEQRLTALSTTILQYENLKQTNNPSQVDLPTSDTLVNLLEQALQSNDSIIFDQCIEITDPIIIETTCKQLSTNRVIPLIKKLISKFEKRPTHGLLLTHWLASLLRSHMNYLISLPTLSKLLNGLTNMLENRLLSYQKLASLSGRLDILMTNISMNKNNSDNSNNIPKRIYIEE